MNIVNLKEYTQKGLLIKNLEEKSLFDAIVYEKLPDIPKDKIQKNNIQTFQDLDYDFGSSGKLINLSKKHKNILIVLDKLNPEYLIPFVENAKSSYSIINTSSGMGNFSNNKNYISPDVGIMSNFGIDIYSPYDFISFFQALKSNTNTYIKVNNKEIPMNLLEKDQNDTNASTIDLRRYECSGNDASILSDGNSLNNSIKATQKLQNEGINCDLFGLYKYDFKITEGLKESLEQTQHLILVLETNLQDNYLKTIKSKLRDQNLINTKIDIVYPKTQKINSNIQHDMYTKSKFDSEGIVDQVKQILS